MTDPTIEIRMLRVEGQQCFEFSKRLKTLCREYRTVVKSLGFPYSVRCPGCGDSEVRPCSNCFNYYCENCVGKFCANIDREDRACGWGSMK